MTLKPQLTADGERRRDAAERSSAAVNVDAFVINLCSSTTPMALVHPDAPELKRFRFFVSRRLEDGRERFRLHMGYFETLEEAEEWLSVVRDIYPGAWAGEAPGKRLRARAAAAAEPAPPAAPPAPKSAPPEEFVAAVAMQPAPPALPPPALALTQDVRAPAAALPKPPPPAPPVATAPAAASIKQAAPAPTSAAPRKAAAAVAAPAPRAKPLAPLSNVREVLASLDDRDASRRAPAPSAPAASGAHSRDSLSDTQVMQILEARQSEERARADIPAATSGIPVLRPDDTGTRRALKEAVQDNAAVSFAVQLQWSVQPMALDKVPPLAIFSAYTLYTVEGSREGRKWYGLRLGFFSDATAAKQVAHYVRSDFASVAVVPVSPRERGRATSTEQTAAPAPATESSPAAPPEEIKLLDEEKPKAPARTPATPMRAAAKLASGTAKTASPAARAAATRSKKLRSKERSAERRGPYSLEETLEILGAGGLEIDNGRGELINESGVRHLRVEVVRKNSPFQRLIARLTERARKS